MKNIRLITASFCLLLVFGWSCKKTTDNTPVVPILTFSNFSIPEGNSPGVKAVVNLNLSVATSTNVTVQWSTNDSTAKLSEDYTESSGTITFLPGETTKSIEVPIISDTLKEADEIFIITLDKVSNATYSTHKILVTILNDDSYVPPVIPKLTFVNVSMNEGNLPGRKAMFNLFLSEATTNTVTAEWSTQDGNALAGQDYTAASNGQITFQPGEISKVVEIPVVSDTLLEFNEQFYVNLSNVTNATADKLQATVSLLNDDGYTPQQTSDGYITPDNYPLWNLTWSDEFNGSSLDMSNWKFDLGAGGWGNNELQTYTSSNENIFLQNGYLTIRALKNAYSGAYTSSRIVTQGKKEFTYGRIDIRAKMPIGKGVWPAIWMLGGNITSVGWPACGEIDIMEYLGHDPLTVYGTAHYNDAGHQYKGSNFKVSPAENYHDKFHVFTIIWQDNSIDWYVDYHKYFTVTESSVKFSAFNFAQFFIMNVAVGGNWPGYPDGTTVFPQEMVVDYVRVFN